MEGESEGESYFWPRRKAGIASVIEDPVQPEVVWEQILKDVEAEKSRKAMTSPGLLIFFIEKGYIKHVGSSKYIGSSAGVISVFITGSAAIGPIFLSENDPESEHHSFDWIYRTQKYRISVSILQPLDLDTI